jgi:uncharacterized protein YbcV (DUF1398 family)
METINCNQKYYAETKHTNGFRTIYNDYFKSIIIHTIKCNKSKIQTMGIKFSRSTSGNIGQR